MAGGMANMQKMMKQAQKLQKQMEATQKELEAKEFIGKEPSGMVTATLTGDRRLKDLSLAQDVVDPEDTDMLQDLIIAAVNDGLDQIDQESAQTMGQFTKGIPGF
ncbi:nucleoid-associated protein [Aerococcus urinaehominis]|uniref:Nucleoid-associated protein AWM75_04040 n=1 Tax=Aerococcus urinaehominis TaxID=128944 RepID=A0A0X8FKZ1_9LACT|nr:YbaB/EbfC family nucleoid-associated protein [Aerococcus urinaehominis]AMB99227.1 nucleoid-associated protein [Aerococcus urinaehominis]SDM31769.1 hypothetical protein SAMN04487985_11230 [Aerococcus urinaehominis]